jgi:hypothetical protein
LEIIADPVDPSAEPALKNPPTEVVDLIPGLFAWPDQDRVLCTKGMAKLEIAWH